MLLQQEVLLLETFIRCGLRFYTNASKRKRKAKGATLA